MKNMDDRRPSLHSALQALKEQDRSMTASAAVEARLRAEVASLGRSARSDRGWSYGLTFALAASLTAIVSASVWWMAGIDHRSAGSPTVVLAAREVVSDFVPLLYASVPARSTQIVRIEVERSALSAMGLASFDLPNPRSSSSTVLADVVIGEDGLARAVRFVRVLSNQE